LEESTDFFDARIVMYRILELKYLSPFDDDELADLRLDEEDDVEEDAGEDGGDHGPDGQLHVVPRGGDQPTPRLVVRHLEQSQLMCLKRKSNDFDRDGAFRLFVEKEQERRLF